MVDPETLVIKKYANRRLYDTERSHYITLDELANLVRGGRPVRVVDAKSGADLTRAVLMQVILEEQGRLDMLPIELLHQIIRVQGTVQQGPLASFLSRSYAQYATLGEAWTRQVDQVLGATKTSDGPISQAAQSWMGASAAMAEALGFGGPRAAQTPPAPEPEEVADDPKPAEPEPPESGSGVVEEVAALRQQMDDLLKRLGKG